MLKPYDKDQIIKLVADKLYGPPQTDEDFAVQLLIEHLCLPDYVTTYDLDKLIHHISEKWDEAT